MMPVRQPEPDQHAKDELERLNKSREWLKQYRAAVDRENRMNDKGEVAAE